MASWFSSLNPTPAFPDYTGPYQVGTLDVEIPVADLQSGDVLTPPPAAEEISTIAFRVFYPCQPPATPARPVRWVQSPQRATIGAFARFLGANNRMADVLSYFPQLLTYITIPAHRGAALHAPVQDTPRWPVMVFSHGLGGSRNTYSHYCGSLASHGMIVLAPEHRDGSGPVSYIRAVDAHPARSVDYRRISHAPSAEVYQGRDEQLSVRLWELGLLHKALLGVDAGTQLRNLDTHNSLKPSPTTADPADGLAMFRGRLDVHRPGAIAFAGHSFGACTSAQFVKSVFYSDTISTRILSYRPSAALTSQITPQTPLTLLDMWAMPFSSPATRALAAKPLPCFADPATGPGGAAVLSILSAAFFAWRDNCAGVKRILRDPSAPTSSRPAALLFYPLHSAHLSQSDFAILFPNITKYLARAQEPERTLRLNVRATLEVLRRAGASVAPTSAADVLDGAPAPAPAPTSTHSGPLAGDWQILSTQADAVRGWVAIPANEADEAGAAEEAARAAHRERPRPMRTLSSAAEGATSGGKLGGETHKPMDEAFGDSELSAAA